MTAGLARLAWAIPLALVPYLALVWRFAFVTDDAYISFRYARNLARGLGLVYNPGAEPPVEGYSEFLWVLLLAPFEALGIRPEAPALTLSILSGVILVLWAVSFLARRIAPGPMALGAGALLVGTCPPLAVWSTGGMATMPFALAVFAFYERLFGQREQPHGKQAALAACGCVLLRADGALFVFLIGSTALAMGALRKDRLLLRAAWTACALAVLVFAGHVAWRYGTYGDWMPNTARAKIGGTAFALERGSKYLAHFFLTMPGLALCALLPLGLGLRCLQRSTIAALLCFLGTCAYSLWAGGDFMAFGRFVVPALIWMVILGTKALAALEEDGRALLVAPISVLLIGATLAPAFGWHSTPESWRLGQFFRFNAQKNGVPIFRTELEQWGDMRDRAQLWIKLGRAVALHSEPQESLVAGAIGALGYESDCFMYDQFGLVTREVALRPSSGARMSPGHDKAVSRAFFDPYQPTWSMATIVPKGAPVDPRILRGAASEKVKVRELFSVDGFDPGSRLLLIPPPGP